MSSSLDEIEELRTQLLLKEIECEALRAKLASIEVLAEPNVWADPEDVEFILTSMQQRVQEIANKGQKMDWFLDMLAGKQQKQGAKKPTQDEQKRSQAIAKYMEKYGNAPRKEYYHSDDE